MSDAAITTIVSGVITAVLTLVPMVIGFLTLWVRLKYGVEKAEEAAKKAKAVEEKIDNNTQLTKEGTEAATANAKKAADAVTQAAEKTEAADKKKLEILQEIAEQTNGMLGQNVKDAVSAAIHPLQSQLTEHDKICDDDRTKINQVISIMDTRLTTIEKYAHESRHDLDDALQTQAVKLDLILKLISKGD